MKKFVCVCEGGNIRSVGMAYRLKDFYRQDALSASVRANTPETLRMLFGWADVIILMQPVFREFIPSEFSGKVLICDVSLDSYGNPLHEGLQIQCQAFIDAQLVGKYL